MGAVGAGGGAVGVVMLGAAAHAFDRETCRGRARVTAGREVSRRKGDGLGRKEDWNAGAIVTDGRVIGKGQSVYGAEGGLGG